MSEIQNPEYAARIGARFGEKFLADLHSLWTNHNIRLNDVGKKYGITREYVRQLFNKIYGVPYTKLKGKKDLADQRAREEKARREYQKRINLEWRADNLKGFQGSHAEAQLMVHDICVELGYEVEVVLSEKKGAKPKLVVNGHRVIVAWASKPHMAGKGHFKWPYWRFGSAKSRWENFDFAILCANKDPDILYFIVPKSAIPVGAMVFIRQGKSKYHAARNRYYPYLGAWHLLEV